MFYLHELKKKKKENVFKFYFAIVRSMNRDCHEVLHISVMNFCALFPRKKINLNKIYRPYCIYEKDLRPLKERKYILT